jgi:hypothetical protein
VDENFIATLYVDENFIATLYVDEKRTSLVSHRDGYLRELA